MIESFNFLETGFIRDPSVNASKAINQIFDLVGFAEDLGFERFWLSEHYSPEYSYCGSPEILISLLAGMTKRISIGSAGILLKYHSVFRIAQNFKLLSAIFPGRIDLGIVGADISEEIMLEIANCNTVPSHLNFLERIKMLNKYLRNESSLNVNGQELNVYPIETQCPNLWIMGNGNFSNLDTALSVNANLCFSLFHSFQNLENVNQTIQSYQSKYMEKNAKEPIISILLGIACSDDKNLTSELNRFYSGNSNHFIIGDDEYCFNQITNLKKKIDFNSLTLTCLSDNYSVKEKTMKLNRFF